MILDEFAKMPKIPNLAGKISLARGRGIRFNLIVQSLKQIDECYKDVKETLVANCNTFYLLTNEIETAKYISDTLGKYTAYLSSDSESLGSDERVSTSVSTQKFGRELFTPQELMFGMKEETGIYIVPRSQPAEVHLQPNFKFANVHDIEDNSATDIDTPRPPRKVEYFVPTDYELYITAYMAFWGSGLVEDCCCLDELFKRVVSVKK